MEDATTRTVEFTAREQTVERIDRIRERTLSPSRSDAIRRAVDMADTLVRAAVKGERIIIEGRDGSRRRLVVNGVGR